MALASSTFATGACQTSCRLGGAPLERAAGGGSFVAYWVAEGAEAGDLDLDGVPVAEEASLRGADAGWGAGGDDVAW